MGSRTTQLTIYLVVTILLLLTFVPIIMMIIMSFKDNWQIYTKFWSLPKPWVTSNFLQGYRIVIPHILNTIVAAGTSVILVVFMASLAGYAFGRLKFPGKEFFFLFILGLMMIPSILTLIPSFVLVNQLGLLDTIWALILPWTAHGQMLAIMLLRNFMEEVPEELFEAARMDGASEFQLYYEIAVPLCRPILSTVAILHGVAAYNDYIWPLITISSTEKQVVSVALQQFTGGAAGTLIGPMMAAYCIATVPLLFLFFTSMRTFMSGLTAGALKI